jgi:glyoxylase-like metal-dependent hydrolase (beta-lactamase superfamily II)
MWIKEPGVINEQLEYYGEFDLCTYLLKGEEYMFIEGAMSYIVPSVLEQLDERGVDTERITRFLILHSHYDHCGVVPPLKKKFPHMKVVASPRSKEIYAKEKAIKFIRDMNRRELEKHGMTEDYEQLPLAFDDMKIDETVSEGDVIDLGKGVTVEIMAMPGHSSCSLAAYAPSIKALFGTDAAGIPDSNGVIFPAGNEDYLQFQRSLSRLSGYPLEFVCPPNHGVFTGQEARDYIKKAMDATEEFRLKMLSTYQAQGDIEKATEMVTDDYFRQSGEGVVPREIMQALIRSMVKNVVAGEESG